MGVALTIDRCIKIWYEFFHTITIFKKGIFYFMCEIVLLFHLFLTTKGHRVMKSYDISYNLMIVIHAKIKVIFELCSLSHEPAMLWSSERLWEMSELTWVFFYRNVPKIVQLLN